MDIITYTVTIILPYVTLGIFCFGVTYRIVNWLTRPMAIHWILYPSSQTQIGGNSGRTLFEILSFRSIFQGEKKLWTAAWLFHLTLAIILLGHVRVFTDFPQLWLMLGLTEKNVDWLALVVGGSAGIISLVMLSVLLARRLTIPEVKSISDIADFLLPALLLAIVITGDSMRFLTALQLEEIRRYFAGLATFSYNVVPQNPIFLTHFFLVQLLMIYMPFSKIMHFVGLLLNLRTVHGW
ncbi:MAG: respiratory nitrate reductase subunit gamma [Candidatus Bathyarchaeia archaeon]